jgi:uncharacterized integral membrane protein
VTRQAGKQRPPREYRGTGLYAGVVVAFVLGVAIVIAIIQNLQTVEVKFLGWDVRTPLVVVLLVTILATLLLAALGGLGWRRRRRRQLGEQEELRMLRGRSVEPATGPAPVAQAAEAPPPPPYPYNGGPSSA